MSERRIPRPLVAHAGRRQDAVRSVPARLPAARRTARRLLRAQARAATRMVLTTYGRSSGFCIDPVEKKPLNQFYPGSSILSFGTAGCNLACKFCQNWDISKSRDMDRLADEASPEAIAEAAARQRLPERRVHLQRSGDLRRVRDGHRRCVPRARHQDRRGHRGLHARRAAARVLREDGRGERRPEGVHRRVLLQAVRRAARSRCSTRSSISGTRRDVWFEITTLLIPGKNDSSEEIEAECKWIMKELGPDVPLHFTAFHPDYKMTDMAPTPADDAAPRARASRSPRDCTTSTPATCTTPRAARPTAPAAGRRSSCATGTRSGRYRVTPDGTCPDCGAAIAGRYEKFGRAFGPRRIPVAIHRPA